MSKEDRIKLALVGPREVGKTCIANYLAGDGTVIGQEYRPTMGLRIREFERTYNKVRKASVELWDVSGDTNFENCWAAISQDLMGVVIVFDPESITAMKDLEFWYQAFVKSNNIDHASVLVLAHTKGASSYKGEIRLPKIMTKINSAHAQLEEGAVKPDTMMNAFDRLVEVVATKVREKEESRIMS